MRPYRHMRNAPTIVSYNLTTGAGHLSIDPRGHPTVVGCRNHCFHTSRPSVPTLQNQTKIPAGRTMGLAKLIIDDFLSCKILNLWIIALAPLINSEDEEATMGEPVQKSKISGRSRRRIKSHQRAHMLNPLKIYIDGPFGAPASNIFRAKHAVLIATGIGVTPFSSILQSIMMRFWANKKQCPNCNHKWTDNVTGLFNLNKVTHNMYLNWSTWPTVNHG